MSYRYGWQCPPGSWKGVTWHITVLLISSSETPEHTVEGAEVLKPRLPQHGGGTTPGSSPSSAQRGHLSTPLCHQIPWTRNCSPRQKLSLHFTSQHSCLKTNQSFQQPNRKEESCGLQGYRCTQAGGRGGGVGGDKGGNQPTVRHTQTMYDRDTPPRTLTMALLPEILAVLLLILKSAG